MRVSAFVLSNSAEDIGVTPVAELGEDGTAAVLQAARKQAEAKRGRKCFIACL